MKLRRLAQGCLTLTLLALAGLTAYGWLTWNQLDRQLEYGAEASALAQRAHQMNAAIDYAVLVHAEPTLLEELATDARRLGSELAELSESSARQGTVHLEEIARIAEALVERNDGQGGATAAPALRAASREFRIHHIGLTEALRRLQHGRSQTMLDELYGSLSAFIAVAVGFALLVMGISVLLQHRMSRPVQVLDAALGRVSRGHLDTRIPVDGDDEFGRLAVSFNRMAEQRQDAEARLADSEKRFRQLTEAIGEVFWLTDPDSQTLRYVSPAYETLWGRPVDALYARPDLWLEAVHADDREQVEQAKQQHSDGHYQAEYRIVRDDGSVRWIRDRSFPVRDPEGRVEGVAGVARDITESRKFQIMLGERVKELDCLYQVLELTISDRPVAEIAEHVSALLARSLLQPDQAMVRIEIEDQTWDSPAWNEPAEFLIEPIVVKTRTVGRVMVGYRHPPHGDEPAFVPEETSLVEGVAVHLGRMLTDRRMARSLARSDRLKAVGELTGGITHDFNNLLTVILGNAEMLGESLEERPELAELAGMIRSAAQRGAELTQRLLAFARRQALEPRAVDVNALIGNMEGLLTRTLGSDIALRFEFCEPAWPALVDPAQLESAVLNLCLNARDAMPGGGRLTLETSREQLDADYARPFDELEAGDYFMLAVSDTGQGIAPADLDRVFEPFFSTKANGSGLGLSMVYGLVKQSRGHIRVYSEPDQGTTIRLYLPRATSEQEAPAHTDPGEAAAGNGQTILLVEDDELVRAFARECLAGLGYCVVEAGDGPSALDQLEAHPEVELLFTDVIMPGGMSGKDLANEATARRPDLKVLYTSGYTENAIVHHGRLDAGVLLLSKPYRRDQLRQRLHQALTSAAPP